MMSPGGSFERILALLHEAALDDDLWPEAACLIDEVSQTKGNALAFGEGGSQADAVFFFVRACFRGQRRRDLERAYFSDHWQRDESIPRICWLPDGELVHTCDLYTDPEKKTSRAYNESRRDAEMQNGLCVRLDGPNDSNIVWNLADPIDSGGWNSSQIKTISRLLPHVRQFVRVRQVLAEAEALGRSLVELLDNTRCSVLQLDRQGRIATANDLACSLLRQGDGLFDRHGFLRAGTKVENTELQRLLARAVPPLGGRASAGSMMIRRRSRRTRLVVHVNPVVGRTDEFVNRRVAALVLVVDPESRVRIDPDVVAAALDLTATEGQLAAMVAMGHSVRRIAALGGRTENTVRWHLKQIFRKQRIATQADLVRRVLSTDGIFKPGR